MLSFARRQDLMPEPVDVISLLLEMSDLLQGALGPTIAIHMPAPASMKPVLVDPNQLELAVLNLAVNARDAMPEGGRLRLAASEVACTAADRLGPGAYLRLSMTDSGSGMDAATLARALEPFFTTKGVGKGTGLGLAMVHGLAVQSGGKFVLESTEGVGTTATLWLPVAAGPSPTPPAAARAPAEAGPLSPLRILAVDDDPLVLAGTTSMLEHLGHSVLAVSSAEEALAMFRTAAQVDLVLSDQVMPGMSGAHLVETLRKTHAALPMILASGFAEQPGSLHSSTVKLAKPFDMAQLAHAISQALRRTQAAQGQQRG
jgi:CheY-like chemotaxis protein